MRKSWTKGTQAQQMTPLGSGEEGYQGFDYGGAKPKGGHKTGDMARSFQPSELIDG